MSNLALYLISVLVWGSTWFAIEFQLGLVEPEVSIVYRYVGASLLLFGWSFYRRLNLRFGIREHGWFLLMGMFLFGLAWPLYAIWVTAPERLPADPAADDPHGDHDA